MANLLTDIYQWTLANLPASPCSFQYLLASHLHVFTHLSEQTVDVKSESFLSKCFADYNKAIQEVCRNSAPYASNGINRRQLRSYVKAITSATTCSYVCFICARRFFYSEPQTPRWLRSSSFFSMGYLTPEMLHLLRLGWFYMLWDISMVGGGGLGVWLWCKWLDMKVS